ncbi:class I SAM-dependent methyltransferase [Colwellia sp. RE-S-Sl-9]
MSDRAFLDFYDELNSIPVHQHGAGSALHFAQRNALFLSLGITQLVIKSRTLLEIGPGSGDNALHLASWSPKSISFVDGANAAVSNIQKRIDNGEYGNSASIIQADVSSYSFPEQFDLVLCEGLIPGQKDPAKFLNNVLSALKPNGICVFTTVSSVSYLAEICRRILLPLFKQKFIDDEPLFDYLTLFFKEDLNSLSGMSRHHKDWVLDNIIHSWTENSLFSLEEALVALPDEFNVLGCSPKFIQDWRWYKESHSGNKNTILQSYTEWSPYLIDYRVTPKIAFEQSQSQELLRLCDKAMQIHNVYRTSCLEKDLDNFILVLKSIDKLIGENMIETSLAINNFIAAIPLLKNGDFDCDLSLFRKWFGRGQQYLSVVR